MSRTVIRLDPLVDENGEDRVQFRPDEPVDVPEHRSWRMLSCDPGQGPFADLAAVAPGEEDPLGSELVKTVGEAIHAALCKHPGVQQALDRAANVPVGSVHPIHLVTTALWAESIPWEALHHPTGRFLALDTRFPIVRSVATGSGVLVRQHDAPLRLAAILAAVDRDARGEWDALHSAITLSGLETQVTLFVAHDDLEAEVLAAGESWVEVRRVPPMVDELKALLEQMKPHILHIFSHGSAGGLLEVATPGSVNGFGDPPLFLEPQHLEMLADDVWLVTLDACEGASPMEGVHSLAFTLVERGVPAAIGMREVIDSGDANSFCRAFYTSALSDLAGRLLPGTSESVDWASHLTAAREALCARLAGPARLTAGKQKPWTLPVLYRQAEDLVIETPAPTQPLAPDEREELLNGITSLRQLLQTLHPDTPEVVRENLRAQIETLEQQLQGN